MKKSHLLTISFLLSIIGILILQMISVYISPPITEIKNIDYSKNKILKLRGNIESIRLTKEYSKLTLKDNSGKINIYVPKEYNFSKNATIEVIGKITEYNNYYQIFPEKIFYLT
ncbi:MAG: OB-fold nucleic acid binding domain-containing protein [Candidatus Pacearchaeota archaeon]|jgi:hypothetical protein